MSVENLRVNEPGSKGWANLYMNNLTVYDTVTAKKFTTSGPLTEGTVPYVYNGSVTPKNFPLSFHETGGLVNMHTLGFVAVIPANDSANIRLQPVAPPGALYEPKREVAFPVWLVVDGIRELCSLTIETTGDVYLFRPPGVGGALQNFIAGDVVEFLSDPTFTYVRA